MKRLFSFLLAVVIVVSLPSHFAQAVQPAIQGARPSALAAHIPGDVLIYGELKLTDVPAAEQLLSTLSGAFGQPLPKNLNSILFNGMLAVDIETELLPALGDYAGIAVRPTRREYADIIRGLFGEYQPARRVDPTQYAVVAMVRDEARLDSVLQKLRSESAKQMGSTPAPTSTATASDVRMTLLSSETAVVQWPGYFAVGDPDFIMEIVQGPKTSLAQNRNFQQTLNLLKPDNSLTFYIASHVPLGNSALLFFSALSPSISNISQVITNQLMNPDSTKTPTPRPTPTATPQPQEEALVSAIQQIGGTAFALRAEGKALIIDEASYLDPTALKMFASLLNLPVDRALLASSTVLTGSTTLLLVSLLGPTTGQVFSSISINIDAQVTNTPAPTPTNTPTPTPNTTAQAGYLQLVNAPPKALSGTLLNSIPKNAVAVVMSADLPNAFAGGCLYLEAFIKTRAILSRSGYSFSAPCAYLETEIEKASTINLRNDLLAWANGDFALYLVPAPNSNLAPLLGIPLDFAFLAQVGDTTKANQFIGKVNTLLTGAGLRPQEEADKLNTVKVGELGLSYGLSGDTFVFVNSSARTQTIGALGGTDTLGTESTFKAVQTAFPPLPREILYLDLTRLQAVLNALPNNTPVKPILPLFDQFTSAAIVQTVPQGTGILTRYILMQK